jgi:hypothetical protein
LMVDLKNPGKSKLLEMAITPHGNAKVQAAAFGGPNDEGFKTLRKWTYMLAKNWQEAFADPEGMPQIAQGNIPDLPSRRPAAVPPKKTVVASKMKPAPDKPGFGSAAADDAPPARPSLLNAPKKTPKPQKEEGDPLDPGSFNEANGDRTSPSTVPNAAPRTPATAVKEPPKSTVTSSPAGDLFKDVYEGTPASWKTQKKAD